MTTQELHEALRACGFAMTSAEITPEDIAAEPMLQLFQWSHLPVALQAPCGGALNPPHDMLQRLAKCQVCGQVVDLALPEPTPSKVTK